MSNLTNAAPEAMSYTAFSFEFSDFSSRTHTAEVVGANRENLIGIDLDHQGMRYFRITWCKKYAYKTNRTCVSTCLENLAWWIESALIKNESGYEDGIGDMDLGCFLLHVYNEVKPTRRTLFVKGFDYHTGEMIAS